MSMHSDPGPNDPFWDQFADLDLNPEVVNVQDLSTDALLNEIADVKKELQDRQETLNPTTEKGRELHSRRAALIVERRRRWPDNKE